MSVLPSAKKRYLALLAAIILFLAASIGLSQSSTRQMEPLTEVSGLQAPVLTTVGKLDRMQAVYADRGKLYAVEERSVYVSSDEGQTFRPVGYLPRKSGNELTLADRVKTLLAKNRITRSLRRTPGAASLAVLDSGTIIVVSDRIYRKAAGGSRFEVVPTDSDFKPPFNSGRAIAVGPDDTLYFGEYTTGPYPSAMRIFRGKDDGREWEIAYMFPDKLIYHVHSVVWDPYRERFWVATGDADSESHIFYTEDEFDSLRRLGGGSQDWRAVALLVNEDNLIWGSDNGYGNSSVFKWDFSANRLEELVDIGNPASYVAALADGTLLISTSYIPNTEFGQSEGAMAEAALWASPDGDSWSKVYTLPAPGDAGGDKRPQIRLPGGDESVQFAFISPLHTSQHDFAILKLRFGWEQSP